MANRHLSGRTAILAAAIGSLPGCDIPRGADNPLDELYIESITTNGKGCPKDNPNSVEVVISDDEKHFGIVYRDMQLTNPPGPAVKNLSCQTGITLHVPDGYQIAIGALSVRGSLVLAKKIQARVTSAYFFAGTPLGPHAHDFVGPYDGYYEFDEAMPLTSPAWSGCGGSVVLGINTALHLDAKNNPNGQALFNADIEDGEFRPTLHWIIRAC